MDSTVCHVEQVSNGYCRYRVSKWRTCVDKVKTNHMSFVFTSAVLFKLKGENKMAKHCVTLKQLLSGASPFRFLWLPIGSRQQWHQSTSVSHRVGSTIFAFVWYCPRRLFLYDVSAVVVHEP